MRILRQTTPGLGERLPPGRANAARRGFSFVEVLVSTVILGVVGSSLCAAFAFGFYVVQASRLNLRATQILTQKTESIRLLTWNQVLDTKNYLLPTFEDFYDPLALTNNCSGVRYRGTVRSRLPASAEVPEDYRTNMRTITVTLYWTNYHGYKAIPQMRQMETRVARNGMQNYVWGAQ